MDRTVRAGIALGSSKFTPHILGRSLLTSCQQRKDHLVHKPWMDVMTKLSVMLAEYDFEFNWTNGGRELTNWRLVEARYFADYDRSQPVNNSTLDDIKA